MRLRVIVAFKKLDEPDATLSDRLISTTIKKWTKSDYFHTEIVIDNKWISSIPGKGIEIRDLHELSSNWDYLHKTVEITSKQYQLIMRYIESQLDADYDYMGIIWSQVFGVNYNTADRWFCSEFVTKILQLLLIEAVLDEAPNTVSPERLYQLLLKGWSRGI